MAATLLVSAAEVVLRDVEKPTPELKGYGRLNPASGVCPGSRWQIIMVHTVPFTCLLTGSHSVPEM